MVFVGAILIGTLTSGVVVFLAVLLASPVLGQLEAVTPAFLAALSGVALSFAFDRVPALSDWFNGLNSEGKVNATRGGILGVAIALFGLTCIQLGSVPGLTCDLNGGVAMLSSLLFALVGNQANYTLNVKPRRAKLSGRS